MSFLLGQTQDAINIFPTKTYFQVSMPFLPIKTPLSVNLNPDTSCTLINHVASMYSHSIVVVFGTLTEDCKWTVQQQQHSI